MKWRRNRRAWEDWGKVDPLWAVLTEPGRRGGRWDLGEFLASGKDVVDGIWSRGAAFGVPAGTATGLDFGCGAGRLTRAMARHVTTVTGVDIAESMIAQARRLNADLPSCSFATHRAEDLRAFGDRTFDVVMSLLVLQHLPSVQLIETYLAEFVRVLAPGGLLAVQLPTFVPPPAPPTLRSRSGSVPARELRCDGWESAHGGCTGARHGPPRCRWSQSRMSRSCR